MRDKQRTYESKGRTLTQHETIVAYLWEVADWVPTHELCKLETAYGHTGSDGDRRARELSENECEPKLRGKVRKERGEVLAALGLKGIDKRYSYYKYV